MSLSRTLVRLNQFSLRNYMGILANHLFAQVTNADIASRYYELSLIHLIGTLIPMLFVYCMIPSNQEIKEAQEKFNIEKKKEEEEEKN